jgi:urease accessory protein UreE
MNWNTTLLNFLAIMIFLGAACMGWTLGNKHKEIIIHLDHIITLQELHMERMEHMMNSHSDKIDSLIDIYNAKHKKLHNICTSNVLHSVFNYIDE